MKYPLSKARSCTYIGEAMGGVLEVWRNLESYYSDLPSISIYTWKLCCQECVVGLGKRSQPSAPLSQIDRAVMSCAYFIPLCYKMMWLSSISLCHWVMWLSSAWCDWSPVVNLLSQCYVVVWGSRYGLDSLDRSQEGFWQFSLQVP